MSTELPTTIKATGSIGNTVYFNEGFASFTNESVILSLSPHTVIIGEPLPIEEAETIMQRFADFLSDSGVGADA